MIILAMPICHLRCWDEHRFGRRSPTRNTNQSKFMTLSYPFLTFVVTWTASKRMIFSWLSLFGHHSHHRLNKKWFPPLQKTHWRRNSMDVKSNGNLQINPNSRSKIELMILRIYRKLKFSYRSYNQPRNYVSKKWRNSYYVIDLWITTLITWPIF